MEKQAAHDVAALLATIAVNSRMEKQAIGEGATGGINPALLWGLGGAGVGGAIGALGQLQRPKSRRRYIDNALLGALAGGIAGAGGRYALANIPTPSAAVPTPESRPPANITEAVNAMVSGSAADRALPFSIAGGVLGASSNPGKLWKHMTWLTKNRWNPLPAVQESLQHGDVKWTPRPFTGLMPTADPDQWVRKFNRLGHWTGYSAPPVDTRLSGDDVAKFLLSGEGRPSQIPLQRTPPTASSPQGLPIYPTGENLARYAQPVRMQDLPQAIQQDVRRRAKALHFAPSGASSATKARTLTGRAAGGAAGAFAGSYVPTLLDWLLRKSQAAQEPAQ